MKLKNSRGLFFSETHEPQISYWANPKMLELEKESGGKIPSEFLNWKPCAPDSRSNCPELHNTMNFLVKMSDPRWRARAKNIYAGRTYSNDDMAESKKNLNGGMIAISHEYTAVISAYAAMYEKFLSGLDFAKTIPDEGSHSFWSGMRDHLDESIDEFRSGGILSLKGNPLMAFPDEEIRQGFEGAIFAAEAWTVAHEFSHHMVRDLSTRTSRRDRDVVDTLRELTANSSVGQEIRDMTAAHRDEINADLLAGLILSGYFTEERNPIQVPGMICGAVLALITIAHFRDEWTSDRSESHPGCLDRIRILLTVICEYYGKESVYPNDPDRSYMIVRRVAGLLMTFTQWAHGSVEMDSSLMLVSLTVNSDLFDFSEE